jgi:predicted nucleic acid-binding protein
MSDEASDHGRQFVDTNVLVYAYDSTQGAKHERGRKLMADLWKNRNGCVSVQVLQEFYVTVTRKITDPISPDLAVQIVTDLTALTVHAPVPNDVLEAIQKHLSYQIAFWDAMILQSAQRLKCGTVWSEDLAGGRAYDGVRVENPFSEDS